jgi:transposase-like protein
MPDFGWSKTRLEAAQLVAYGELSFPAIASKVGIARDTLFRWRRVPEFAARVEELTGAIKASLRRLAVSRPERRVDRLNRDWLRLQKVIEERAADPKMAGVPGGDTGLLTRDVKGVGSGEGFRLVELYEVDAAILKELREIERQAAKEIGWGVDLADQAAAGKPPPARCVNDWRAGATADAPGSSAGAECGGLKG